MTLSIRQAVKADLPALIGLLSDDTLGTKREATVDDPRYLAAWEAVSADPHQHLLVAELRSERGVERAGESHSGEPSGASSERAGEVVGMMQVTRTPGLSRSGAWRATLESVRIRADLRGRGYGTQLIEAGIELARLHGCRLVQLTSDVRRTEAHRFYGRLGFKASHTGFKLDLT